MLSLLFFQQKTQTLEEAAFSIQNGDIILLNTIIHNYKPYIKKVISAVCKRYIDESDDEFSVGLMAFNDALFHFDKNKGSSLLALAEVMIKRRVIDYIRSQARHQAISLAASPLGCEDKPTQFTIENTISLKAYEQQREADTRKEEIIAYQLILNEYGLSFEDLVNQSPKHEDARINAMKIAQIIAANEQFLAYLLERKRLPIKLLEKEVSVSRKTIERNRKYIIAIVLILIGDFLFLQEYVKGRLD